MVTLGLTYRLHVPSKLVRSYLSAGPRLFLMRTKVSGSADGQPFGNNQETASSVGVFAALGTELHFGPGAVLLELSTSWARIDGYVLRETSAGALGLALAAWPTVQAHLPRVRATSPLFRRRFIACSLAQARRVCAQRERAKLGIGARADASLNDAPSARPSATAREGVDMHFEATEEQAMVRDTARDFAEREVRPHARRHDREAAWPGPLVKRLGELGLMGVALPESSGGSGADHVSYALAVEEVSAACASLGVIMSVNNSLVCDPLSRYGTPAQQDAFLVPLARGDRLGCFGLTEPASGSDATQMTTVARKVGDDWLISGSKNFITNAPHADLVIVFAATEASTGVKGSTAFIVPRETLGYEIAPHDEKLGIRGAHSSSIHFDECKVPDSQRLGGIGEGVKIALSTLDGGRIGIAAQALGIARAAFEEAVAYARERKAFGEVIAKKQAIQFMLADMATELDAARQLVLRAAWLKDQKRKYTRESAMAKLYASEMSHRVCHKALQVFGGYGYTTDFDVERHYRDARITEIYEGTSEIMRVVIGSTVSKG